MTAQPADDYQAYLFDLDGVITRTAQVHAAAWQRLFDEFLAGCTPRENGADTRPFDLDDDYVRYIDGRRRADGVRAFLDSRGIRLAEGEPDDGPDARTVNGLANRKNGYFEQALELHGVGVYDDAVDLARGVRARGCSVAVVSASENCAAILRTAGLLADFDVLVTGIDARLQNLPGKPAPDTYLEAARRLHADAAHAVVLEDAIAGVQAGVAGGFGLVVGVDRRGDPGPLQRAGADVVLTDLRDMLTP